jgi:amino acid adenylation domain-containing protein
VPIDAAVPPERLRRILDGAGIALVLTQSGAEEGTEWPQGVTRLSVDTGTAGLSALPVPPSPARPGDLAYVIFTSGSTGTPKGVMIEHAAAVNTVADINERFGVTARDRALGLSAFNFDLSVYDVFGMLSAGGALVLPEPEAHREPGRWLSLVREHQVTVWNSVPALMEMFTEHAVAEGAAGLPLRVVMMSGDWIPVTLPGAIRGLLPRAEIYSLGGATEASIWSILHPIDRIDPEWTSIPYGKPLRNQRFHVLDDGLRPRPAWVPGDLYIAGIGLARGYLNDHERTDAAFPRHPATGERLYRTGDLGRYLPDGTIEFLGRQDLQVKIQGYRIELGEVEAGLLACPGVRAAVASATGARHARRLVAHVVLEPGHAATEESLRAALGRELPAYLVPSRIHVLDALPLSANGKVDRSALPSADGDAGPVGAVPPADALEESLTEIWREFFDGSSFGVTDSFFALGGDSLLGVRLMARIRRHTGRDLPVSALFASPTIRLLAGTLREHGDGRSARRSALVPVRAGGDRVPLFFVHPVGGDVMCYAELAALLGADQPFLALQVPDADQPGTTVEAMAADYAREIIAARPDGPYRVGGWSMGGVIALEIGRQLTRAGRTVELVAAVDLLEPPGTGRAEAVDDGRLLAWFARDLAGLSGRVWSPDPDALRPGPLRPDPVRALHGLVVAEGLLPPDIDVDTLGGIVDRFARNCRALLAHRPARYGGRVRLLRARDGGATAATTRRWLALCDGDASAVDVPGDHYSVMRAPHVATLAQGLCRLLADADAAARDGTGLDPAGLDPAGLEPAGPPATDPMDTDPPGDDNS